MRILWILAATLVWLFVSGCVAGSGVEPRTGFSIGPFGSNFIDTKNNDVEMRGLKWKDLELELLKIRNNSSDVMAANVAQMAALNEQFKTHGENLRAALNELKGFAPMVGMFTSGASVSGPLGSANVSNSGLEALAKALVPLLKKELAEPPASQPVE